MRISECGIGSGGFLKTDVRCLKPVQHFTNHGPGITIPESRFDKFTGSDKAQCPTKIIAS